MCQCKVSLTGGWMPCDDTSLSLVRYHDRGGYEDEHDDINVVFDMRSSAALSKVSSSDIWVINCLVTYNVTN